MNSEKQNTENIDNIYRLDGRVPLLKAIPFGLQHVLAMFVSNLAPITIVAAAAQPAISQEQVGMLLQNAMFVAGLATLIQLYPIWKIGSGLPIVMGVSFTFVTILCTTAANYGYPTVVGAVFVGGILEGTLGLFGRRIFRFIKPIVAACVVSGIGLSLFTVGVRSFGGGYSDDFGSPANLFIGTVTLVVCIIWSFFVKGYLKQLSVLAGLIVGYIISIFLGKVDLSTIMTGGLISFPHFLMFIPKFNIGSILSVFLIFMVSATETIGDTTAMVSSGLKREITTDEISGSLAVDGYASSISSLFGCPPVTSFSQNVGLISMTKVVNRFTIMTGAVAMILGGLIPPIGNFFASLPQPVLGGCTIMMFGQILVSGIQMIAACGFDQRNIAIASLSLALGAGLTASSEQDIWKAFPQVIQDVFSNNIVAVVFIIAMILSYILPEEKKKDNG
ncbi:MAG: purine permease [Lachnospiraceae bacterium]|nr:purine permease [Lachnospiraceae bacterium]